MNSESNNRIDEVIIGKFLAGEASEAEKQLILDWLAHSKENRQTFESYSTIWNAAKAELPQKSFDADKAWKHVEEQIMESDKISPMSKPLINKALLKWAASFIIIVGLSSLLYFQYYSSDMVVQKATNEPKLIILPDGSEVNLMPGAQISYPESFAKDNRKVELNGLAEFKVQHQTDRPFLVNAALMQVEVLGTQFSFYSSKDSAAVYLFEGRVAVRKEQGAADAIVIKPGMSAIYTKAYKEIVVDSTRAQGDYHANDPNRQFEFNSIPLGEAIQALEEVYKVNIKFDQSNIALCLLTAEFRNQTIEEILAVIAGTFQLRLEIKENTYTLYGEGC